LPVSFPVQIIYRIVSCVDVCALQAPSISTDPFVTARLLKRHFDRYSSDKQ